MSKRVLLVDDEPDIVLTVKFGLEENGFQVDAFTDPTEALSHFKEDYYELILLDIKMPKMSGFELGRALAKIDRKPKICFMTAFEINLTEAQSMFPTLEMDGFLKKPFEISKLLQLINNVLISDC